MIHSGIHEEIICQLYPFMTSNYENRLPSDSHKTHNKNIFFFSKNNDNLMYCIYLVIKNTLDIDDFKTDFHNISPSIKDNTITKCKLDNGSLLKNIKQSKTNFINTIFSSNKLEWEFFYGMCIYNDMVIVVLKNKIAYIYGDIDVHNIKGYITLNEHSTYFQTNLNIILNDFFIIKNPLKPIRTISHYKLQDLKDICDKLDISYDSMKKNEIYSTICKYIE